MKLQLAGSGGINLFTAYGTGYVAVGQTPHRQSIIVLPDRPVEPWQPRSLDELTLAHFDAVLCHHPEIILLGSGATMRFPSNAIRRALASARVGLEVMDTPAACRTYNILASEGRRVAAALIVA